MKRGTPDHPKTQNLARALDLPLFSACGLLELLWHFTAKFAPQGDVGRWSNEEIAVGVRWPGDPDKLVAALVDKRWLDESDEHRLVVHDWHDHADDTTKKHLHRSNLPFLSRSVRTRPDKSRQVTPAVAVAVARAIAIAKPEPEPDLPAADAAPAEPPTTAVVVRAPSWSDEACALWTRFLGTAPGGRIGKALKPFVTEHGWEVVRPLWQEALEDAVTWDDPGKFVPELFGRTFKARLARSRVEVGGLVRVGIPPPTPKEQKHRAALMAGVAGGLKGDGTFGRGE